jgi:hypothetical protein
MRTRPKAAVAAVWVAAAAVILAGCSSSSATAPAPPKTGEAPAASPAASPTPTTQAVKDLTPGNCTMYPKDQAVSLLGGVNDTNPLLQVNTDGGTKIDTCSYLNIKGVQGIEGTSYGVVRFDSPATAFSEAQKLEATMLDSATEHDWAPQPLTAPAPGAGQLLGGFGTKTDQGVTYTLAVVGTNVGPYLVAALGASTQSPDQAKNYALKVFSALSAQMS